MHREHPPFVLQQKRGPQSREGPHLVRQTPWFPTARTIQRAKRPSRDTGRAGSGCPTRARRAAVRAARRRLRAGRQGGAWRRRRSGEARRAPSGAPARVGGAWTEDGPRPAPSTMRFEGVRLPAPRRDPETLQTPRERQEDSDGTVGYDKNSYLGRRPI